ncbi:SET domain-containing protein 3 [Ophidiomyces ophidiicola]|nr:SET domain-containing protein 3 [Ophidiomyces ophidiicola]
MTEASFANTHSTAQLFPVTAPKLSPPAVNGANSAHEDEEEPYTIKCICIFDDDDGSTVFCERCETWQHIVCYYDGQEVPDIHNCADCEPRALDSKRATERQKKLREQSDSGDRKGKRSGAKGQKRKIKDVLSAATDGPNARGSHERSGSTSGSREQQPQPKKRPTHRSSASTSSVGTPTIGTDSKKRGTSSATVMASPIKTNPHPPIPLYSQEFLHLYDNDEVNIDMHGNLFDTLELAGNLASWVQDPVALARVANGRTSKEVFTYSDQLLDSSKWPVLSKQSTTDTSIDYQGTHPSWRFLKVEKDVRKDEVIGEVRGKVGHFRDYCLDPSSRWQELRHPEPFVFFHPQLPIYIDSRKEGTLLRYIRRSCRPNVTLKTFITNEIEYHFCFVANQDIPSDSEVTATWYLDPQLFPASNGFVKQEGPSDVIPDAAAISISNVLAHFGGCACDPSQTCLLASVDRRHPPRSPELNGKQVNGRRKKGKNKPNISPASTGCATNSRAGSEVRKHREDEDLAESRSVSGSVRDHPHSRDMTPTVHSPTDAFAANGPELSAREKRKIAAAEKKFEQLEHDQQHAHKKRRRNNASASIPKFPGPSKPPRLDTMPARRSPSVSNKASPNSAVSRQESRPTPKNSATSTPRVGSPMMRMGYVDSGMQTESDETDPHFVPPQPPSHPPFVPLTRRLLFQYHHDRLHIETNGVDPVSPKRASTSMPPPPIASIKTSSSPQVLDDIEMKDADTNTTPKRFVQAATQSSDLAGEPSSQLSSPSSFPLASTAAHNFPVRLPPVGKTEEAPASAQTASPASPCPDTPVTDVSPSLPPPQKIRPRLSPIALKSGLGISAPSPVKKRMSLGDYMSRRGNLATSTTDKAHVQSPDGPRQATPTSAVATSMETAHPQASRRVDDIVKRESDSAPDIEMKDVPPPPLSAGPSPSPASVLPQDPRLK